MRASKKRFGAVFSVMVLCTSIVGVLAATTAAHAGAQTNTNACFSNATATYSDINIITEGTPSANPITLGDPVTLQSTVVTLDIAPDLLIAGYNLGFLTVGVNNVPAVGAASIAASNTVEGTYVEGFSASGTLTITDPDGIPGTGDESATPLSVPIPLADSVWTSTGGNIAFSQGPNGSLPTQIGVGAGGTNVNPVGWFFISAQVGPGGIIKANFDCQAGVTDPLNDTTFTPGVATPFETVVVNAPPTPPTLLVDPLTGSVGGGESINFNLLANAFDVNGDIDPSSLDINGGVLTLAAGDLTDNGNGTVTYTNTDVGATSDSFTYSIDDLAGLGPVSGTVNITILGNFCTSWLDPVTPNNGGTGCSLDQIITVPIVGDTMTFEQAGAQVLLGGVFNTSTFACEPGPMVLNGQPQTACGAMNQVSIVNARGTDAGWDVTGQVTDFTDGTVADCTVFSNHCIPGDNLGWSPFDAQVTHIQIPGDVATVADGATVPPVTLGGPAASGLHSSGLLLCSAPATQSGGSFSCDAGLALGVPASTHAGNFTAVLTLTLA